MKNFKNRGKVRRRSFAKGRGSNKKVVTVSRGGIRF